MNRVHLTLLAMLVSSGVAAAAGEPAGMRDAFGVAFESGPAPQRIVSLSPNLTEILFAVGVDRL